ncbi:hypothetical protein PCE31106_00359 [Pandoraea cepalis]|uniref:Uncharacterized protein n=1 Tax=Pandoraea cepalis TaxID=2508294 RepID=A0A5E4RT92_9BURK|nr:hypothetical protein [Pandoraea cepalis]VVD66265.1 hypothetical protein PCE31106_00359 [Pandoraea cepalis]
MRFPSHHRAIHPPPCYRARDTAPARQTEALTAQAFPHAFHGTRNARQRMGGDASVRHRVGPPTTSAASPWSAAFAVMLVANLMVPPAHATPMLPRRTDRSPGDNDALVNATAIPSDGHAAVPSDVERYPLSAPLIKSHYTLREFLRAVATASAPFRHLGKTIGDAYTAVTGNEVDRPTLETAQRVGSAVDAATGLIPEVQLSRLPGQFADLAADVLEGKPPPSPKLTDVLQYGDPRAMGPHVPIQHASAPAQPVLFRRAPMHEPASAHGIDAAAPVAPAAEGDGLEPLPYALPEHSLEIVDVPITNAESIGIEHGSRIDGEHEYLQGYEQSLPIEQIPDGPLRQLMTINGRHFLVGESGYYHVTPGQHAHDWLIHAPRGTRAQVPVTYDASTGEWRASAPLRLCGGGCGPSRESTPDSVAMSKNDVADAIRHIADHDVRSAIQQAYSDLAGLHLMRTNREDLRALRDNSIIEHRRILVPQLMRIDPHSTLFEQQREAALITAIHYDNYSEYPIPNLSSEAFCQENAEILFHYLLTRGVPSHHIRMITVQPQGRPQHVMVLYSESDQFIDLLDLSTPQPPVKGHVDGVGSDRFTAAVFLTRDTTLLLDPWSRIKASSFRRANDVEELMGMLDISLADAGHRAGNPYTVSLTRPYPTPRERAAAAQGSAASMGNPRRAEHAESVLLRSGSVRRNPPIQAAGGEAGTPV